MDVRIAEVEQMIADCNAHTLVQKQLSVQTEKSWKSLLGDIKKLHKAAVAEKAEAKEKSKPIEQSERMKDEAPLQQTQSVPVLLCAKCGETLKTGVKFCKRCGTRVEATMAVPQPAPATRCACGEGIVTGAKFCRKCGKPVRQ